MDARIVVSEKQFDELLEMLERPPSVSLELRREVAEVRRRWPGWFPASATTAKYEAVRPYLSSAEREFLEGSHAGRH